ncbi:MAG: NAD-glutamate dehydrogenase [Methylococcaceae bacterium]|nr:NAD-glutamate dehydrogenase [Methylococcaceae bacterium]
MKSNNCCELDNIWKTSLKKMIRRLFEKQKSSSLWLKYQTVFSADYQSLMPPRYAISDIVAIENTLKTNKAQVELLNPERKKNHYRLHFYSLEQRYLDEYFPILGNLNLRVIDQVQFPLKVEGKRIFIKSFTITVTDSQYASFQVLRNRLLNMIQAVLNGRVENDPLNSLLILTGLLWQEIDVLRAYRNYFLQLAYKTTRDSFHNTLLSNPEVALNLFKYFDARFKPDKKWIDSQDREEQALFPLRIKLLEDIEQVVDINHDRILRTLFNLIDATVRCNFYVRRNLDDYFIAFKIKSLGVIDMPSPRPENEIYIHAAEMEGIHLRGGKISRGGIRWSDRVDDFRTEILGLMQTQMSKNVLIIPKGAKGGFIVKKDCADSCFRESGKKAYMIFIQGLLDLTDNYIDNKVVVLPGIVSYDYHDPYLVVAADKGTAQFSDLANSVAKNYHYWLGDAFASGGSEGYNHKKLGITARGAWESVKRHFRELGKDIQQKPFSVVGIGSMDGDVFGNGMLLSPVIQLLAAVSGEHIFIDPAPVELHASLLERWRLFELPHSSWDDYNRQLISEGGGVFKRNSKAIIVSPTMKKWLGIRYKTIDGETLIRYLLKAQVELLWLGGIGTYVKSSVETDAEAGDRANDSVRINASDLQAQVVGEGANLAFTQKARIEYALAGGQINTDAIDNSAGVDISDHEVNLKILLMVLYKKNRIKDDSAYFKSLTEQVSLSVLQNNYKQTLCLSLEQIRCATQLKSYLQLADQLEASGYLDRKVESFMQEKEILSRQQQILMRPELAVIMAASKMQLTQKILEQTDFLEHDYFKCFLLDYFPKPISKDYANDVASHPLARAIKATCISNKIINQAGGLFLQLSQEGENNLLENSLCYLTFDKIINADELRQAIYDQDNKVNTASQYEALLVIEAVLFVFCRWSLLNGEKHLLTEETVKCYQAFLQEYKQFFLKNFKKTIYYREQMENYKHVGFPQELAENICFTESIENFPFLVTLTVDTNKAFLSTLQMFNECNKFLDLDEVYAYLKTSQLDDYWEEKVCIELQNDLKQIIASMIKEITHREMTVVDFFSDHVRKQDLQQYQTIVQKIKALSSPNLMPFIVLKEALVKLMG